MERVDSKFCEGCAGALTAKNIELDDMRAALASKEAEIQALAERCAGMQKDRENLKLEIIALRVGEIVCRKCTGHARGSFFHCPWCGERRTPEEMRGEDG